MFGVRRGPSTKGIKIREGWIVIVVSVPQRQLIAIDKADTAKDGLPLIVGRVDATGDTPGRAGVLQLHEPGLVSAIVSSPVVSALNVQPHSARPHRRTVAAEVGNKLTHLSRSRLGASGARKQIDITSRDASTCSSRQRIADTVINVSNGLVASRNDIRDAGGGKARSRVRVDGGTDINTVGGGAGRGAKTALQVRGTSAVASDRGAATGRGLHAGTTAVGSGAGVSSAALDVRVTRTQT